MIIGFTQQALWGVVISGIHLGGFI
jgi:hypothetical protein